MAISISLCTANTAIAQEDVRSPELDASLGYHYSTGKYGGDERTDISFVPLVISGRWDSWSARLGVPYIHVNGIPELGNTGEALVSRSGSGLGDVTLNVSYTFTPWRAWMPFLDVSGRVKFPTADKDRGLGTGEFDYQSEIGISKTLGSLTPYASVGYRWVGSPVSVRDDTNTTTTFDLNNVVLAEVGTTARVRDDLSLGLSLFYQESASASAHDQLDLMPFVTWRFAQRMSISTYSTFGLQDGSPDFGVGAQLKYRMF